MAKPSQVDVLRAELDAVQSELLAEKRRFSVETEALKRQLTTLTKELNDARCTVLPKIPEKTRKRKTRHFVRLICSDLHGSHYDAGAVSAMFDDCSPLEVREIVLLGDMLECGGWLSANHTLGYVAQLDEVSYQQDTAATNVFLDKLQKTWPKACVHYLEGNHEHRVEAWAVDTARGSRENAQLLLDAVGPETVLSLRDRGVEYYRQGEAYCDLDERGVLKLGKTYFTHGFTTAKHAASKTAERFAGNVMYGHTHRADVAPTRLVSTGLIAAWCPGCLSVLRPRWKHNSPSTWSHGYILQIVDRDDGTFQTIPSLIDNGRSYLGHLVKALKR